MHVALLCMHASLSCRRARSCHAASGRPSARRNLRCARGGHASSAMLPCASHSQAHEYVHASTCECDTLVPCSKPATTTTTLHANKVNKREAYNMLCGASPESCRDTTRKHAMQRHPSQTRLPMSTALSATCGRCSTCPTRPDLFDSMSKSIMLRIRPCYMRSEVLHARRGTG